MFSPEAIHQSPCRRRERLAAAACARIGLSRDIELDADEFEDLEDEPSCEQEQPAEEILDQATAVRSIAERKTEIETLRQVEQIALWVRNGKGAAPTPSR